MKFASILSLVFLVKSASAHYIWTTLVAGSTTSTDAVRRPFTNSPVTDLKSKSMTCNDAGAASATVPVAAGSTIGFKLDSPIGHAGPAAIYLGKAPSSASTWDGSGANWFKIAQFGAVFDPSFEGFVPSGVTQLTTRIPASVPSGEYLLRIEHIGLHVVGAPQWYISCAQVRITGGGSGQPAKVSIPGYLNPADPGLTVDIYWPVPTAYKVPGPSVFV